MGSILNDIDRTAILERIGSVTSASVPRWGRMDAKAMLTHLKQSALMALGELPVASKSKRAFQVFPIKHLILYVVPFPKSAPTAPELIARCPDAVLDDEKRAFAELMRRVAAVTPGTTLADHPAFGDLSYDEYGALIAKHTDHHLRQFGV